MHGRHVNGAPGQQRPHPGMLNARPPMQNGMPNGHQSGQVITRNAPPRGPPRPGMFPTATAAPAFKDLKPGEVLPLRTMSPGVNAGRAGVGAGMGMAPRPQGESSLASLVGRGIDEAGYPMISSRTPQPGAVEYQGQVYRPVPGMGPQGGVGARQQDNGSPGPGMVKGMNQLAVSRSQNLQPRPHLTPNQYPPQQGRSPPLSHTAVHPSRSASLGGASISSTHSTSTTRTVSSSNESALNLRQHYVPDPSSLNAGIGSSHAPNRNGPSNHTPPTRQPQSEQNHRQMHQSPAAGSSRSQGNPQAGSGSSNNPMLDLLSSEQEYVEQLTCIVRKVAAGWSRTNLPPPLLDRMFRAIEGIYKVSKAFAQKLESLGALQPPPNVFRNLLVQWVEDLTAPYERYAAIYLSNFNTYPAIVNNEKLDDILAKVSTTLRPVPPLDRWTIDTFFLLPYARLRYYRRLYQRLLDVGIEGRNDQPMLQDARNTLDRIISSVRERLDMDVNQVERDGEADVFRRMKRTDSNDQRSQSNTSALVSGVDAPAVSTSTSSESVPLKDKGSSKLEEERRSVAKWEAQKRNNASMQHQGSTASFADKGSDDTHQSSSSTSQSTGGLGPSEFEAASRSTSSKGAITPIERPEKSPPTDLEVRLDTARAVDLFTMKPKMCKLQIAPSTLSFTRHLRRSADSTIRFTPTSTDHEVIHRRAHIFVLSDLFLMCERMSATEKAEKAKEVLDQRPDRVGDGGPMPEMWLLYPPLAGRHLSVLSGSMENELIVTVMQRETFLLTFDDRQTREGCLADLQACIDFASNISTSHSAARSPISPQVGSAMSNEPVRKAQQRTPSPLHASNHHQNTGMPYPRADQTHLSSSQPDLTNLNYRGDMPFAGPPYQAVIAPPSRNASLPHSAGYIPQGVGQAQRPTVQPAPTRSYQQQQHLLPTHPSRYGPGPPRTVSAPVTHPESYRDSAADRSNGPPGTQVPGPSHMTARQQTQAYRGRSSSDVEIRQRNIANGLPHLSPIEKRRSDADVFDEPDSPLEEQQQMQSGPAVISARMKCKVFLKHGHQQWKSLGPARLSLYVQRATNIKQLVVEADAKEKTMLISTIVLTDGVERVAKTGVAVEISDMKGARTGIIYMLQLRDENNAGGLFSSLISGSDRARAMSGGKA